MTQVAPLPGTGVNRLTGKPIAGWAHVIQSIHVIFSTRIGERVMRRWFGSDVPAMLGRNLVPSTVLRFWTAVCMALELWEPRFKITKITPLGSDIEWREGKIGFKIDGIYYPRGHLGDFTPAGPQAFILGGTPELPTVNEIA